MHAELLALLMSFWDLKPWKHLWFLSFIPHIQTSAHSSSCSVRIHKEPKQLLYVHWPKAMSSSCYIMESSQGFTLLLSPQKLACHQLQVYNHEFWCHMFSKPHDSPFHSILTGQPRLRSLILAPDFSPTSFSHAGSHSAQLAFSLLLKPVRIFLTSSPLYQLVPCIRKASSPHSYQADFVENFSQLVAFQTFLFNIISFTHSRTTYLLLCSLCL